MQIVYNDLKQEIIASGNSKNSDNFLWNKLFAIEFIIITISKAF
jgi:hypothetical protein